jgi:hypothetical protein
MADEKTRASAIDAPGAPPPLVVSSSSLYAKTSPPPRAIRSPRGFAPYQIARAGTRFAAIDR